MQLRGYRRIAVLRHLAIQPRRYRRVAISPVIWRQIRGGFGRFAVHRQVHAQHWLRFFRNGFSVLVDRVDAQIERNAIDFVVQYFDPI